MSRSDYFGTPRHQTWGAVRCLEVAAHQIAAVSGQAKGGTDGFV